MKNLWYTEHLNAKKSRKYYQINIIITHTHTPSNKLDTHYYTHTHIYVYIQYTWVFICICKCCAIYHEPHTPYNNRWKSIFSMVFTFFVDFSCWHNGKHSRDIYLYRHTLTLYIQYLNLHKYIYTYTTHTYNIQIHYIYYENYTIFSSPFTKKRTSNQINWHK